jgi:hypothetical protein
VALSPSPVNSIMSRAVLILLIVALGLGIFLWWVEMPAQQQRIEQETAAKRLIDFNVDDVQGLKLHSQAGDVDVSRAPNDGQDSWIITAPKALEADPRAVNDLLRTLSLAKVSRVVDEAGTDLSTYGLATPAMSVTIRLESGSQTILFGDAGPLSASVYAKRESEPKILLTSIGSRDILTRGLQDFRRKRVVRFDRDRVTRLKVVTPHDTVVLYKHGQGEKAQWTIKTPIETPADQPEVRSLLFGLEDLKAQAFIDDAREHQKKKAELKHPAVTITLHEEAKDQQAVDRTVALYTNPQHTLSAYAETTAEEPLYVVPGVSAKDLAKSFFSLRMKQLIAAEPGQVKTLRVKKDGEEYSLTHEGKEWSIDNSRADSTRIISFLNRVIHLQAERPVADRPKNLKAYGLDMPAATVTAIDDHGNTLGRLAIGRIEENLAYAEGSAMPGVVQIRPDILREIPKKTELLAVPISQPPAIGGVP